MGEIKIEVFHTQSYQKPALPSPILAKGWEQWLGDGYYFWQDYYFANWWGYYKKSKSGTQYTIYKALLTFQEDDFIDTVFNQEDYYQFTQNIEKFAKKCQQQLGKKPSLVEFNQFIHHFKLWQNIQVIRFQDVPERDDHIEVTGFYYKKRIQLRVINRDIITNFAVLNNMAHY